MSTGRGRGYTGRHQLRSPRPGAPGSELEESPLSPHPSHPAPSHNPSKPDYAKEKRDLEKLDKDKIKEVRDIQPPSKVDGPAVKYHMNPDDEGQLKELLCVDEQYTSLLALLEQFSPGEDGIQFNRKLRHFETTVTNMCPDEAHLTKAFATFRAAALQSSVTARKLAAVGASFTRQQRQQLLRGALLNVVMQGTFSKLDILERANPSYLINAANLMGDYFAEARLCNGNKVHILASPLLQYMRALLGSGDIRAHRSLATQLMQNGRELLSVLAQELDDLSISIRLRLLSPPPVSIIWLLLSADLCLNKFLPLPNTLQQFYASHLELTSDENFSEVSYGSWKKSPEKEDYRSDASVSDISEKVSQNLSQINLSQEDDAKPKLRPILGAGAGLLRQEQAFTVSQDSFETWTSKSNLAKRYDLNSWRQVEDENKEDDYNPTVLPSQTIQNYQPVTVPDYPPPNVRYNNVNYPQENFANYLQQGDGTYIQNQYQNNPNFNSQGDFVYPNERPEKSAPYTPQEKNQFQSADVPPEFVPQFPQNDRPVPERVNNEVQKNASRRPVENWRKEKGDLKEDPNKNRPKNWTRQRSKDNISDEDKDEKFKTRPANARVGTRLTRRNSNESAEPPVKPVPRRHVSEAPRNHKYWDHDDRTDKDYTS